ncbi:flavin-containing monooxygenase [Mycobacterium nebraskense]|uniref:Monooxygenase n=1 Tax=Mycobacterium nebraskense TaxID=244292 RepID=A0A1X1ZP22_9MYCO|nr:NAD(P)/FAD-dependent oxidoreductase [Mycobacterium nebraskense]KKC05155.1 monooxygenase [Mycobacterium nebraskense]MBI2693937.1 NAD(P)/FAD-dependent oxidoreductase [Mycobacterium nebraskense]MCV7118553.1 NAD(P)/FAD-dependent oxidoreductase [Mycobacterium nebraskense]ORW25062.1 monooxygenase [Mycobacterium nebraskense]
MNTNRFDAVIVGAGFGGIGAAIQLKRLGYDNFVILDREDDLGGTWHVNHYPGLAVDIPSTTYSYWFEPNPKWSRLFAPGGEVKQYAAHVADKYDVRRHMRFSTTVEGAQWDEDAEVWRVALAGGETLTTRFLITATGFLSQPRMPDIPGIASFEGKVVHTTAWDHDYSYEGRRIAVIGTGASAVQVIPELAKEAGELTVYQRTATHVIPKFDFPISPPMQRLFGRVPAVQRTLRWVSDIILELIMVIMALHFRQSRGRVNISASDLAKINRFRWIRDKELRDRLTPDYDLGCKRPTFSNGFYRAFTKPHVNLETNTIARIEPDGIVTADGRKTLIDTLVLATGFDLWEANFPAIEVVGRKGRNLGKWWRETRFQAYQGVSMPYFPNYLGLASPFAFSGLSFFHTIEYQMRHMDRLLGEVKRRGATTFEVTEEANDRFMERMTKRLDSSVFYAGNCATSRSYYFSPSGEASLLRPTSTLNSVREAASFPLSDYAIA